jgi:hypothetical protein
MRGKLLGNQKVKSLEKKPNRSRLRILFVVWNCKYNMLQIVFIIIIIIGGTDYFAYA